MRKPKRLNIGSSSKRLKVYANFDETKDCAVYIGGRYYDGTAQIHLSKADVKALAKWLANAAAYLSSTQKDKNK